MIEFSPNGKYLAILQKLKNQLSIYIIDDTNIEEFFTNLKEGIKKPLVEFIGLEGFAGSTKIEFCQLSKYLACYGLYKIQIIDLYHKCTTSGAVVIEEFRLDRNKFKGIMDIQI